MSNNADIVVIGAGTAGMEVAGQLSKFGFRVTLIEKEERTGGHLKNWYHLFPDRRSGHEVLDHLNTNLKKVNLLTGTSISDIDRSKKKLPDKDSCRKRIKCRCHCGSNGI